LSESSPFGDSCSVSRVGEDAYHWQATLAGPADTPYDGGLFYVDIVLPADYPTHPPKVKFTTKIYHTAITEAGEVCLEMIKDKWTPATMMSKVLGALLDLLKNPDPDAYDSPLRPDVAKQYKEDKAAFEATAKRWTETYAQ
jgi:ubiquitin-protein ligase